MAQNQKKERERKEDKAREEILKRSANISVHNPVKAIDEHIMIQKQKWARILQEEGHKFDEEDKESDYDIFSVEENDQGDEVDMNQGTEEQQREAARRLDQRNKLAQLRLILKSIRRDRNKYENDWSVPQERYLSVEQNIELHLRTRAHRMNLKTL